MSFFVLLLACVLIFVGSIALTSWLTHFRMKRYQKIGRSSFCPIESTIAFVLSLIALLLFSLFFSTIGVGYILGLFALLLCILYTQSCFSGWTLLGLQYIICFLGTLLLPQDTSLFQSFPLFIVLPLLSFIWFALLRLVVFADRLPYFSFLSILASGIFFAFCGLLGVLPSFVTQISVLFCMAVFALLGTSRFWTDEDKLGVFGSAVLGFIVGGSLTYIASFGFIEVPIILFSYIGLEWFCSMLMIIISFIYKKEQYTVSFFEQAWDKDFNRRKLIYFTSFCFVLLSLLSVILLSSTTFSISNSIFVTALILTGMVVRYRNWGRPTPSYRDLFQDVRVGFNVLKQDVFGKITVQDKAKTSLKSGRKK